MKKLLSVFALFASFAAGSAFAHSELTESVPADKAVLEAAPKEVVLRFSEAVRLTALSLTKQGEASAEIGPLPAGTNQDFALATPAVTAGVYKVEWRALSDDGHVLRGAFGFTVGGVAARGQQSQHPPGSDHSEAH